MTLAGAGQQVGSGGTSFCGPEHLGMTRLGRAWAPTRPESSLEHWASWQGPGGYNSGSQHPVHDKPLGRLPPNAYSGASAPRVGVPRACLASSPADPHAQGEKWHLWGTRPGHEQGHSGSPLTPASDPGTSLRWPAPSGSQSEPAGCLPLPIHKASAVTDLRSPSWHQPASASRAPGRTRLRRMLGGRAGGRAGSERVLVGAEGEAQVRGRLAWHTAP